MVNVVDEMSRALEALARWELLAEVAARLVEAAAVAVIALALLVFLKGSMRGLAYARVLDPGSVEAMYRITRNIVLIGLLLVVTYILTGSQFLLLLAVAAVAALMISGWDAFSNLVSYYVIVVSRMIGRDEYLVMPNGIHGRVKEIRPFYVVLENRYGYYMVPNSQILRSGKLSRKDLSYYRINIRLWGLQDPALIERVEDIVMDILAASKEEGILTGKANTVVDEISEDSVTLRVVIALPDPEPRPEKASSLIVRLSKRLREAGISHTITFEEPEGYEQRWGAIE